MRLHSDIITPADLYKASNTPGLEAVFIDGASVHGSRKRKGAIEFRLGATPGPGHRRRRNSGNYGAEDGGYEMSVAAATWDEHGILFAALYEIDPSAIIGPYSSLADFHARTSNKYLPAQCMNCEMAKSDPEWFSGLVPGDTHYGENGFGCYGNRGFSHTLPADDVDRYLLNAG